MLCDAALVAWAIPLFSILCLSWFPKIRCAGLRASSAFRDGDSENRLAGSKIRRTSLFPPASQVSGEGDTKGARGLAYASPWEWTGLENFNRLGPELPFLHFRVVRAHSSSVLDRLDQVVDFCHIRVILHHSFLIFQRHLRFLHALDRLKCRLHRGNTGASGHAADFQRHSLFFSRSWSSESCGNEQSHNHQSDGKKHCSSLHTNHLQCALYHQYFPHLTRRDSTRRRRRHSAKRKNNTSVNRLVWGKLREGGWDARSAPMRLSQRAQSARSGLWTFLVATIKRVGCV